jgi:IS1 family transposase
MPTNSTTRSWLFPPRTDEVQLDEKWSFVYKKQARCDPADPADAQRGDWWDHVAYDAEHRLVLCVVPGARAAEQAEAVVADVHRRTGGRRLRLLTTDAYPAYEDAIRQVYGGEVTTTPTGRDTKRMVPEKVPPPGVTYATVEKRRRLGRVVEVLVHLIFGTMAALAAGLRGSKVSRRVNVSFLERYNGTDRHRNARKVRKTYTFSKDWVAHESMTYFTIYSYNFCWPVRTLEDRTKHGRARERSPAMAAGLTDHVWTMREWVTMPSVQSGLSRFGETCRRAS